MFSITAQGEDYLDFAIKRCGMLTDASDQLVPGQQIGLRGPYGNTFPTEEAKGKNLIFIGGGIWFGAGALPLSVMPLLNGNNMATFKLFMVRAHRQIFALKRIFFTMAPTTGHAGLYYGR